jgi:hypothetical protein
LQQEQRSKTKTPFLPRFAEIFKDLWRSLMGREFVHHLPISLYFSEDLAEISLENIKSRVLSYKDPQTNIVHNSLKVCWSCSITRPPVNYARSRLYARDPSRLWRPRC